MINRTKIRLSVIIGLLSLSVAALAGYRVTQLLIESSHRVVHTYKVEILLEEILSQLDDAETGQRGYLLTGNSKYLEPYESGSLKIANILMKTKNLTIL